MVGQSQDSHLENQQWNPGNHSHMPWAQEVLMCRGLHSSEDILVLPACLQSGRFHPHTACQLEEGYQELPISWLILP